MDNDEHRSPRAFAWIGAFAFILTAMEAVPGSIPANPPIPRLVDRTAAAETA